MIIRLLSYSLLICLLTTNFGYSAVATYTLSGGTLTGTLNGVSFSGVNFTITADADPADLSPSILPILQGEPAVSTMTIDGYAPFQITVPTFGPFLLDVSSFMGPGMAYGGFGFLIDPSFGAGIVAAGPTPSFAGNVTITGAVIASTNEVYSTTVGDLIVTSFDGNATFTGQFTGAVPEPTSMAIFGLGALGMAYRASRKRSK